MPEQASRIKRWPTWKYLKRCCGSLLHLFAEIIGKEEVVDISLVRHEVLVMRPDRGVEVILKL